MKKGIASKRAIRDVIAPAKKIPIKNGDQSRWHARIARRMKNIATTCDMCHDVPICAENHTTVPKANTSDMITRKRRETPWFAIAIEIRQTFTAPRKMVIQDWLKSLPKTATAGISTTAGAGG